jgi:hypothetical protein
VEGSKDQYNTALEEYRGTTKQQTRSALSEFNIAMVELGRDILPVATAAVKSFSTMLGWITGSHQTKEDKTFTPSWPERLHELMPWSGASPLPKRQTDEPKLEKQSFLSGPSKDNTLTATPISLSRLHLHVQLR